MTTSTTNLELTTYSTVTNASTVFSEYVDVSSGSSATSNLQKIDTFAGAIKSGSYVVLALNSTLTNEWMITSGSGNTLVQDSSASAVRMDLNYATSAHVTSGSSDTLVISASALASSDYGKRTVIIPLNASASLVGTESNYVPIPGSMNGWKLIAVDAYCSASSTSGSPAFSVKSSAEQSASASQTMLTVNPVIGEGSFYNGSGTGSVSAVIDTSYQTVYSGWKIWAMSSGSSLCGTGVKGSSIGLTFQNLP